MALGFEMPYWSQPGFSEGASTKSWVPGGRREGGWLVSHDQTCSSVNYLGILGRCAGRRNVPRKVLEGQAT